MEPRQTGRPNTVFVSTILSHIRFAVYRREPLSYLKVVVLQSGTRRFDLFAIGTRPNVFLYSHAQTRTCTHIHKRTYSRVDTHTFISTCTHKRTRKAFSYHFDASIASSRQDTSPRYRIRCGSKTRYRFIVYVRRNI